MFIALTRYLAKNSEGQDMYKETLIDVIEHLEHKMPFSVKPNKHKRVEKNIFETAKRENMSDLKYYRKKILRDLEILGFIELQPFGRFKFEHVSVFKMLQQLINDLDEMIDKRFNGFFAYLDFVDDPDETVAKLYEVVKGEKNLIKSFYRDSKPYLLIKYFFDHEYEQYEFKVKELFQTLDVHKQKRKLSDWIADLKIDEGERRGRYIRYDGDTIYFKSDKITGLRRQLEES